jgi:hypothetical protein
MSDPTTTSLRFDPWPDEVLERIGFHARSDYVERVWTSAIGPTAVLALRSAVLLLEAAGGPVTVELADFARSLGVGAGVGRNAVIVRTLVRLDAFDLAYALPSGYALRCWLPPLRRSLLSRAPTTVQLIHERYVAERRGVPPLAS